MFFQWCSTLGQVQCYSQNLTGPESNYHSMLQRFSIFKAAQSADIEGQHIEFSFACSVIPSLLM